MREYRAELTADFRQYYGLSLQHAGIAYPIREAADLAVMLPRKSRTYSAIDPAYSWDDSEYMLMLIANDVANVLWLNTKDGENGTNRPKPIKPPKKKTTSTYSLTPQEVDEVFARAAKKGEKSGD